MEQLSQILASIFIVVGIYFLAKNAKAITKAILVRLVAIVLSTLVALFAIDIVVFHNQHSMRAESRGKILQMVGFMVAGLMACVFYNNNKKE